MVINSIRTSATSAATEMSVWLWLKHQVRSGQARTQPRPDETRRREAIGIDLDVGGALAVEGMYVAIWKKVAPCKVYYSTAVTP